MKSIKVAVIGGGAAGFFGAISCANANPEAEISLFEKSNKLLSKVKISGGGRCNVTNACFENHLLIKNYPRGSKELKLPFSEFSVQHTVDWFEARAVKLKTEKDGRIFPESDNSQSIIDCLVKEARVLGIKIFTEFGVKSIAKAGPEIQGKFHIILRSGESLVFDHILIASGGNPNNESYNWLRESGHTIIPPVPSLFTFNVPDSRLNGLQGISVQHAEISIKGTKLEESGPIMITHWGFSGPAILRLSAWGARTLSDLGYDFRISINWIPEYSEKTLREKLEEIKTVHPKKIISGNPMFDIPRRLWERLTALSGIEHELRWLDVSKKSSNKLIEELIRGEYIVKGKTTFKEEFVTCGGVSLSDINMQTMESLKCPGLFFAGEVLDIDGITGGFNFQAAWTTGFLAGRAMGKT